MSVLIYRPLRVCYYTLGTTKTDISAFRYYDGGLIVRYPKGWFLPATINARTIDVEKAFVLSSLFFEFEQFIILLLSFSSSFLLTTRRRRPVRLEQILVNLSNRRVHYTLFRSV